MLYRRFRQGLLALVVAGCAGAEVERLTLTDGRVVTGMYDEASEMLDFAEPIKARVKVPRSDIAAREAVRKPAPAAAPAKGAATAPATPADAADAAVRKIEGRIRVLHQRGKDAALELDAVPDKEAALHLKERRLVEEVNALQMQVAQKKADQSKVDSARKRLDEARKQRETLIGDRLPELKREVIDTAMALEQAEKDLEKAKGDAAAARFAGGGAAPALVKNAAAETGPVDPAALSRSVAMVHCDGVGTGSGCFVHERGLLVTNNHVVASPEGAVSPRLLVSLDGSQGVAAEEFVVLERDQRLDLALLAPRVAGDRRYAALHLGDTPPLATEVVAAGFPLAPTVGELTHSTAATLVVTKGAIASVRRDEHGVPQFLQLDVRISSGNSGGPIVNAATGAVVGVVAFGVREAETRSCSRSRRRWWPSASRGSSRRREPGTRAARTSTAVIAGRCPQGAHVAHAAAAMAAV